MADAFHAPVPVAGMPGAQGGWTYWGLVWKQFKANRLALAGAGIVVLLFGLAAWAPILANGKPFLWTEDGATTYPLLQYMVAPTQERSVDYLFNYFFFLTLTLPLLGTPVALYSRNRSLPVKALRRRAQRVVAVAALLALLPFLDPGFHPRAATTAERKESGGAPTVRVFDLFRLWRLDARDYLQDGKRLDPARGDYALFPPVAHDPITPTREVLEPPGREHGLGTDQEGRDVLARMLHGTRISISVGFISVGIAALIGIFLGGLAGYYRGWVDIAISRLIELAICFPSLFLIITIIAMLEKRSVFHIMLVIGLTSWPSFARLTRGEFLRLADQDFVHAARALGCRGSRVMFRHILPNALGPVLVAAAFGVAGAVLTESALSYLGIGAPPPTPTWGEMISQGKAHVEQAWWLIVYPGCTIFLTVTVYNLAGDGLRDAMDPRLRK